MKLKHKRSPRSARKVALLAALMLLQGVLPPASSGKAINSVAKTAYAPDVDIYTTADFGPNLRGSNDVHQFGTLIAIDGIYVRGKTISQINKLLSGEASMSVECTFLDQNEIKKVILPRTKAVQENGNPFVNDITGLPICLKLDCQPGTLRRFTVPDSLNNDLAFCPMIARAAIERTKIEQIRALPFLSPSLLNVSLVMATTAFDRMGDTKAAKQCINSLNLSDYFLSSPVIGLRSQGQIDSRITYLIQDLMETGRYELLCRIFTEMKNKSANNIQPFPNQYFDALTHRGNLSASERADLLKFAKETLENERLVEASQLCDDLERVGEFSTASALYAKMAENDKKYGYKLASAQQKSGDLKTAIVTAKEMLSKYDLLVPTKLQAIDEQLDMRFPRRSDLELLLANFEFQNNELDEAEKYVTLAIDRIQQAVGAHNSSLKKPYEVLDKIAAAKKDKLTASQCIEYLKQLDPVVTEHISNPHAEYELVRTATASIDENELSKAMKAIRVLLEIYRRNEQNRIEAFESLNLLSALTIQARALADHGYLDQSDELLNALYAIFREQTAPGMPCMEIDLELLINKGLREKHVGNVGEIWNHSFPATCLAQSELMPRYMVLRNDVVVPMQQQEILREQAVVYEYAGDLKRANIILDHALAYRKLKIAANNNDDQHKLSNQVMSILLLDKARLLAKGKAFDEARSLAHEALGIYGQIESATYPLSNKAPYDASRIATFEKLIRNKTVALARVLIDNEKLDAAQMLLELLQSQIEPNQGQSGWIFQDQDSVNAGYEWMVAANIADVYFRQNAMTKAKMWIDKAVMQADQRPSQSLLILAAKIAVADGDHEKAEPLYKKAADNGDFSPAPYYQDEARKALLALSKSEGAYSHKPSEDESINVSIAHAKELWKSVKLADALAEYKKVYALLADNDKRRLDVRQSVLTLERNLNFEAKLAKTLAERGSKSAPKLTAAEEEKLKLEHALEEISDLKELTQIAEKTNNEDQWRYWLSLANLEVEAKDPKDAAIHAYKFLKTCPLQKRLSLFPISSPLLIAIAVSNQQTNNDGEAIMRAYIASFGGAQNLSKSLNLAVQSELLAYYIGTGRYAEAKAFMPKLLKGSGLAIINQRGSSTTFQGISFDSERLSHEQNIALARQFIEIEKKELPIDAHVLGSAYDGLAANEAKWGMRQAAIRDYLESERIEEKYTGLEGAPSYKYKLEPLLVKTGDLGTLEIIKQKCVRSAGYVNPSYPYEHIDKSIDKDAPLDKKIEQAEVEYASARNQAIYSVRSEYALNNVVLYTQEANQWQKAIDAHLQICDFFEHSGQTDANFQEAHFTNWDKRVKYYLPTVDAYLKLNDKVRAIQVIERALNTLPDLSSYEAAELGMAAFRAGDAQLADKLASRSEGMLKKEASYSACFEKLAALWRALGHEDNAARVVHLQEACRQQEELQRSKKKELVPKF
jgi:hypothetical protein